jgi:hypothetical protein
MLPPWPDPYHPAKPGGCLVALPPLRAVSNPLSPPRQDGAARRLRSGDEVPHRFRYGLIDRLVEAPDFSK